MSYDAEVEQQPAPAPLAPPMTDFAFGQPSSGRQVNVRLVGAVAAVAVLAGGGFVAMKALGGHDAAPPATITVKRQPAKAPVKAPAAKPGLTTSPDVVLGVLRNAATAEESYFIDNTRYTTRLADLTEQGLPADARVKVRVVSADARRFCLNATGATPLSYWYDSRTGKVSRTACR